MFRETKGMQEYIVYICMKKKELICTSKVAPKKVLLINVSRLYCWFCGECRIAIHLVN